MNKKISQIFKKLYKEKIDYYLISTKDEYLNEYAPSYNRRLEWLTNFKGSNGIAFISKNKQYLFTDGRYLLQAEKEIDKNFNIITLPFGLSNRNADVTISEQTESIQPHRQWGETQLSGRIRRFDEVIEEYAINRIDFLKMDIEGCEPDLLEFTDIMKNIKYIQFEFGRAWPDLNQYGIGEVMKQYEDTHDFFFIKDKNHPTTNTIDAPLFTLITEPVLNELNHHLINDRWGYGGNILMVNKNINFDYKKINEDNKPKPKARANAKPKVIVYERKK